MSRVGALSSLRQCTIYSVGGELVPQDNAEVVTGYRLVDCYDTVPQIRSVPRIEVFDGLLAVRLAQWKEDRSRTITFDKPRPLPASFRVSQ